MPLLKIHVENAVFEERREALTAALKSIRAMLCEVFQVEPMQSQLAIIPVFGVDDQAPVAAEIHIMPRPERTNEVIAGACQRLRDILSEASGTKSVIRATQINPAAYMTLK